MSKIRNCLKEIELSQKVGISDLYVVDLAKMRCGLAQLKYLQLFDNRNFPPSNVFWLYQLSVRNAMCLCFAEFFCMFLDFGFSSIFHLLSVIVDFS